MRMHWNVRIRKEFVPGAIMDLLRGRWPDNCSRYEANFQFAQDDPAVRELVGLLNSHDLQPIYTRAAEAPGEFSVWPTVEYEPHDIENAEYLRGIPGQDVDVWDRRQDGCLRLSRRGLRKKMSFAAAGAGLLTVSSALRRAIEEAGMIGPVFRPTVVVAGESSEDRREIPWDKVGMEPVWEMQTSLTLPPLSPRCRLVDERSGQPCTGDPRQGRCYVADGEFPIHELHYLRKDLQKVEPFDVGHTWERLARVLGDGFTFVFSRRFKALLDKHGIEVGWDPVYLDDSPEPQGPPMRWTLD